MKSNAIEGLFQGLDTKREKSTFKGASIKSSRYNVKLNAKSEPTQPKNT